jgi:hypothetical protein
MIKKGTKVTFTTPATKVGSIVDYIPAYKNRAPFVASFLYGKSGDYEVNFGADAILQEDSYLIVVDGACSKCRKRLYHIPASNIVSHDEAQSI